MCTLLVPISLAAALCRAAIALAAACAYAAWPPGTTTRSCTACGPVPKDAMISGAVVASCAPYSARTTGVATTTAPAGGRRTPRWSTTWPLLPYPAWSMAAQVAGSQPTTAWSLSSAAVHVAAAVVFAAKTCAAAACACFCAGVSADVLAPAGPARRDAGAAVIATTAATTATTTTAETAASAVVRARPILPVSGTCRMRRRTHKRSVVAMTFTHDGSAAIGALCSGAPLVPPAVRAGLSSRYPDGGEVSLDTGHSRAANSIRPLGPIRDISAHPALTNQVDEADCYPRFLAVSSCPGHSLVRARGQ